jgi:hypothetical protein
LLKIRKILLALLSPLTNAAKWDWAVFSLCLLIATSVWTLNKLNKKNYTTLIEYPINLHETEKNVVAYQAPPDHITVNVSGTGWDLLKLSFGIELEPLGVWVDSPLDITFFPTNSFEEGLKSRLHYVKINHIVEDSLFFNYDKIIEKQVFLYLDDTRIDYEPNYRRVSFFTLIPSLVTFRGPTTLINQLADSLLVVIPEEEIDGDYSEYVELEYLRDPLLKVSPQQVKVAFEVDLFLKKQTKIPIQLKNFPNDSSAYISENSLKLDYVTRRRDEMIELPDSCVVILDYMMRNTKDSTLTPTQVDLPSYFTSWSLNPDTIKIHYK